MGASTTLETQLPDPPASMHPNHQNISKERPTVGASRSRDSSANKWSSNAAPTKPASITFDHSIVQPREPAYKASTNITAYNISHHLLHLTQQHISIEQHNGLSSSLKFSDLICGCIELMLMIFSADVSKDEPAIVLTATSPLHSSCITIAQAHNSHTAISYREGALTFISYFNKVEFATHREAFIKEPSFKITTAKDEPAIVLTATSPLHSSCITIAQAHNSHTAISNREGALTFISYFNKVEFATHREAFIKEPSFKITTAKDEPAIVLTATSPLHSSCITVAQAHNSHTAISNREGAITFISWPEASPGGAKPT
ncbi:hypothetical protein Nepgr_013500 [Nepenthes gracilis]|uniref:Uncharacterized protein n=1 Tax=Nepenthes gracilis TaxID=150966 RepID=A0AAD3SJB3_NEPGR|nr:hypothetical protein Nepgr_013500 [Nepenthes gracilis]